MTGLYLCIFEEDGELDGVKVGPYVEFRNFRDTVVQERESGELGARFPTLILHSDCDGQWSPDEARTLEQELIVIGEELRGRPPISIGSSWGKEVVKRFGLRPDTLYDCFFDVDGEPLVERLVNLVKINQMNQLPIIFQ